MLDQRLRSWLDPRLARPAAALLSRLADRLDGGTTFLALSSLIERRRQRTGLEDDRSLVLPRGLAEGTAAS